MYASCTAYLADIVQDGSACQGLRRDDDIGADDHVGAAWTEQGAGVGLGSVAFAPLRGTHVQHLCIMIS